MNKITYAEVMEKWQEIIATAENGDPQYSFRLFNEIYRKRTALTEKLEDQS